MDLTAFVDGVVHEPTQTAGPGLDLTVDSVLAVAAPGRVDFGGGELETADLEAVETAKRNPDDDYGWWDLREGTYLLSYNETLSAPADVGVVLQTRDAVRARGATHPTLHLDGRDEFGYVPLSVGDGGIRIKENARVSTLRSFD